MKIWKNCVKVIKGVNIMQHTMALGRGGGGCWRKKYEKCERGKEKLKKRGKISHLFGLKSPRWEEDLIMIELHNIYPWVIGPDPDY